MILENIDPSVIIKHLEHRTSPQERATIHQWLEADEKNRDEYRGLVKLWAVRNTRRHSSESEIEHAVRSFNDRVDVRTATIRLRRIVRWTASAAAVFAAALVVIGLLNIPSPKPVAMQTVRVPAGQRVEIELPDKTHVWVNAKSTLTYPVDFGGGKREVTLDGEAFFDVEADPGHPFQVNTSGANLVVTGTEFNVSSYSGSDVLSVALLEGKVSLQSVSDGALLYTLSPNEQAVLSNGRISVSSIKYPDYFRWREGLICFNNETVGDIINKLELYYDVKIEVQRADLLQRRYSGKFRTKAGVEQVLRTLQLEHKFKFIQNEENNRITIK